MAVRSDSGIGTFLNLTMVHIGEHQEALYELDTKLYFQ